MNYNYTHVSVLLDRSGSMISIKDDTIGGYNTFLKTQKELPGKLTLTLAQFDDIYEKVYEMVDIQNVKKLTDKTFIPRSNTALLDSLAKLIIDTGRNLAEMTEEARPEKVLVLILTDGHENASKEQTRESIKAMIEHQEKVYNWQFMYIGANQDGFMEAAKMGMQGATFTANSMGTRGAYSATTQALASYRSAPAGSSFNVSQDSIDEASK